MSNSGLDDDRGVGDDHWIFEQLGSPEKPGRRPSSGNSEERGKGSTSSSNPKENRKRCTSSGNNIVNSVHLIRRNFNEKLRIYADNMRKLIVTARKQIKDLRLENTCLKQKLRASGLTECPACLFHFKPEKEHVVLPKYIKVFRGKLSIEIEFSSLEKMSEWLTLNKLDENSDGLPTIMQCEDQKLDLVSTDSLLYKLVKEEQENEAKKKKIVINIRPHDRCPNTSASSISSHQFSAEDNNHVTDVEKVEENIVGQQVLRENDSFGRIFNNANATHMGNEEEKAMPETLTRVLGKENVKGMSNGNESEMCPQVKVSEIICKDNDNIMLEKHFGASPSQSFLKPTCESCIFNKHQNEDIRIDQRYSKAHMNEVYKKSDDMKTVEKRMLNEHQKDSGKIDMESRRRRRASSRGRRQRGTRTKRLREQFDRHEEEAKRHSIQGSSSGTRTSSRSSQPMYSRVSSRGVTSHRRHSSGVADEKTGENRVLLDKNFDKFRLSTARVDHQQRRQNRRNSIDSKTNSRSPLRSPRRKQRKCSVSSPTEDCESADSTECDTSISSSDLIIVDEVELEDGEIVE